MKYVYCVVGKVFLDENELGLNAGFDTEVELKNLGRNRREEPHTVCGAWEVNGDVRLVTIGTYMTSTHRLRYGERVKLLDDFQYELDELSWKLKLESRDWDSRNRGLINPLACSDKELRDFVSRWGQVFDRCVRRHTK